ncbi:hypothetical protein BXZ70DRAFT_479846 [Cristinia sonorae]|uniref:Fungal-type protein kinase domain-containing protein n=1 Tax=Cristinia sonorae TaxID=1940300 RepID=A0A8K0UGX4_9AGAR|nr:hypothetical protein BXZ70DRAFT_479846 [Cristinia sonorae]
MGAPPHLPAKKASVAATEAHPEAAMDPSSEAAKEFRIPDDALLKLKALSDVHDSRKLVSAMRDIVSKLIYLWEEDRTHRDVAIWSTAVDQDDNGVLLDLDLGCRNERATIPRCEMGYYRSGSFHFGALCKLRHPYNYHEMLYDMESCFWVLCYAALENFGSNYYSPLINILSDSRDYSHSEVPLTTPTWSASPSRERFMFREINFVKNEPLTRLVQSLQSFFKDIRTKYCDYRYYSEISYKLLRRHLYRNPESFVGFYEKALAHNEWRHQEKQPVVELEEVFREGWIWFDA